MHHSSFNAPLSALSSSPLGEVRRGLSLFTLPLFTLSLFILFASCSEDTEEYDQYHDWAERNAAWYVEIADSARTAIAEAQAAYGDEWEQHCQWRMIKSVYQSPTYQSGLLGDSICVRILQSGTGQLKPTLSDTVRIHFRGFLMPTQKSDGTTEELVFSQTYYGSFDARTAIPQKAAVSAFAKGFATALQHMVVGDDWMVYIPQELFYGSNKTGVIPSYSTARFRLQMVGVYPVGTTAPEWY